MGPEATETRSFGIETPSLSELADWLATNSVEIAGYQDRLEITSPGALPNSMTVAKMLAGQRSARSPIIVEVLRDYGYVDARGMGVRAEVLPARKARGAAWRVEATDDLVRVTVGKASAAILGICRERPSVTIPELAERIGITERSIQRNVRSLQQAGLLRRVGGRKEGHWDVTHGSA